MIFIVVLQLLTFLSHLRTIQSSPDYVNFDPPELAVISTAVNCSDTKDFVAEIAFNKEFNGVVYAKHYPAAKNCFTAGIGAPTVRLSIDTTLCGVRLIPINATTLAYVVSLVVQSDRYLQQKSNFDVHATCLMAVSDINSNEQKKKKSRAGRKSHGGGELPMRSWMEIGNSRGGEGRVAVGDMVKVTVKALLPKYLSMRVVNCSAHDGAFERSEGLTDYNGCPLDENILPALEKIDESKFYEYDSKANPMEKSIMQVSATRFPAFKFPDAAFLHLQCTIEICQTNCPKVSCRGHKKTFKNQGEIIKTLEVHNSIEVIAPGIDAESFTRLEAGSRNDEKKICLSSPKIAFAFSILGGIFLFAVLTTLCSIMRTRRKKLDAELHEDSLYRSYSRLTSDTDRRWLCT